MLRALDNQARTIRLPSYLLARLRRLGQGEQGWDEQSSLELHVLSLDVLRGEDEDGELLGLLSDKEEEPTLDALCAQETRAQCMPLIRAMLATLSARERQIVLLHFGLDGAEPCNLRQIAHVTGSLSKERVRQILSSALSKLRQSQEAQALGLIWHEQEAC